MNIDKTKDKRFSFKENQEMINWINDNPEKFKVAFKSSETFNVFEDYFSEVSLRYLQAKGILKKFGMEKLGYEEYKNYTSQILDDIISFGKQLGIKNIVNTLENCNNMAEVKKLKYNLLEKIYCDVSDQKFNFNEIFTKVIKVLKKEIPGIEMIDSERKVKIEQRYQECVLYIQDEELRDVYIAVAVIDEDGIRNTYEIMAGNSYCFITERYSETNYDNWELEEKIDGVLEKIKF
jgi:hypothetical protein